MATWSAPWNTPQPVSPEVTEAPAPEVIEEPVVEEPKKTTKKTADTPAE